jgi:hypothetical protein
MSLNRNGFQTRVNRNPPPGAPGDFASMNPRATALAGEGAYRAAAVTPPVIGNFAWGQSPYAYSQKPVGASVLGFVANELQTVIPFLAPGAGVNPVNLALVSGFPTTLYTHGDFKALPVAPVAGIVTEGDTVYARQYDGAPTNDPVAFSGTASQALTVLTVSAVATGVLVPGMVVDSSGADATVIAQLTGTPGGVGTYTVSTSATVGSGAVTVAAVDTGYKWASSTVADASFTGVLAAGTGVLTASAVTGLIQVGANLNGVGVPANLFIVSQLTGTAGGAGTYQVNTLGPAIASVAMTTSEGKLAKITRTY